MKTSLALALATLLVPTFAHADFLINPSGGTTLWDSAGSHDDEVQNRSLGGTFDFYGSTVSSVSVSTNGNLNFSGNGEWGNYGLNSSAARIAGLWDDLYVFAGTGDKITEMVSPDVYSVTYHISHITNSSVKENLQISLFKGASLIGGFQFLPGDIAFSYNGVYPNDGSATIGLAKGDGTYASPYLQGLVNAGDMGSLPTGNNVLLFRPNGTGNYNPSVQAVPEPMSVAALGAGALALLRRRRRS